MSTLTHLPLTALATGATSGLGKAIAVRLARDGMQVVVVGRDAARGAAVVEQIEAAGGQAQFIATDLSDPADITHLAEQVGDVTQLPRGQWVLITESPEGGWGIQGHANTNADITALARAALSIP